MATFIVCGQEYEITRKELEQRTNFIPKQTTQKMCHVVEINGKEYPIKQLLVELTGLPEHEIIPLDAYRVLDSLGYEIKFCRPQYHLVGRNK